MAVSIRLARGGAKKRPFYRVVAADSRCRRDGRFLEKLGTYNPLLPKDHPERLVLNSERVEHWLGHGAQYSDRVARFLEQTGIRSSVKRERGTGKRAAVIAAKKAEAEAALAASAAAAAPAEAPAQAPAEAAEEAPAKKTET